MIEYIEKLRVLLRKPGVRYLVVGGSVYVLELVVIFAAQSAGLTAVQAVAIAFIVGLVISFLLQKLYTFSDKRMHSKILLPQIIAVGLLIVFNFSFTIAVTKLLQDVLPAFVLRTLALGVTTIWNFYLYKTRIFKTEPVKVDF